MTKNTSAFQQADRFKKYVLHIFATLTMLSTRLIQCRSLCMPMVICSKHRRNIHIGKQLKCSSKPDIYDVVVCGGGMVGAAMAAALGHEPMFEGKKVLLLEAGPKQNFDQPLPDKFFNRTCSLNAGSVSLLRSIGAWENILNARCQEVKRMQIWDACSDSIITFNHETLDNLAYVAENNVILAGILKQLQAAGDRVHVKYGASVLDYRLPGGQSGDADQGSNNFAYVQLASGEEICARLLIGADGFKSMLRTAARIPIIAWNYNHCGVVASLKLAEPTENNVAWQRFLKTGPIALLPLSNEYCNLIWSTSPEESKNLMMLPEESFVDAVNHAFWSDEGKNPAAQYTNRLFDSLLTSLGLEGSSSQQLPPTIIEVDKDSRAMFPLSLCHATQYVRPRVALVGDAAHRVHPMAGQGVNLGFGDVVCLRDLLVRALYEGKDVGSLSHLLSYETQRQRHVVVSMASVDGLYRLYGTDATPVVLLRSLGLQATNALRPLKEKMMQFAAS